MHNSRTIKHEFVELMPGGLVPETLYISIKYKCMAHLCLCGCGKKVVTPLSPTGWELTFNGREVSVRPSIGNWNLPCRSHYWIRRSRMEWADEWSDARIADSCARDRSVKQDYSEVERDSYKNPTAATASRAKKGFWSRLRDWWS